MPVRCQDCNSHFLLDGTTVVNGVGCPDCGGTKLERDQPSPTHSDGQLTNMVDPATQLDQGGNPLQEGVWAGVDGGWQPAHKRDEFFARVANIIPPPSGIEPQHHQVVQPSQALGLHNGNLYWLAFLDASVNGKPVREHMDELVFHHGMNRDGPNFGKPVTLSVHHPEHMPAAIEAAQSDNLRSSKHTLAFAPTVKATGAAIMAGQMPAPPGIKPRPQPQPPVMSSHYSRTLPMEPHLPWYHEAADVPGQDPTATQDWAERRRQRYKDRSAVDGHRLNWQPGQQGRGLMIGSTLHTWPVERTMDNPMGGLDHTEYTRSLGVNAANLDHSKRFEIDPDGSMIGVNPPIEATQIDPNLRPATEGFEDMFASTKTSIAPLLAIGGRMLLGQALGGLMRKAIHGAGNFLDTAPQQVDPYAGARPVSLVASEHTAVGVGAPVETPHSTPDLVEDHDPESVDQHEYNDRDMSPDQQNPNLDVGDGGMSQSTGEDAMKQKLEFRHDGDGVSQAEMLLPLIMEFVNSEESGLSHPQLKALHEALDAEMPGYLEHADDDDEAVHKLMEELRKPEHVHATTKESVGVYNTTPMAPGQQQMGVGQQMPMPGTHANPVQQGGMPVSGKCMNCGGTVNADGSCPQCGAAAGANQMGNMGQPGQQTTPLGIMPSPYAHTAADHQGPITPQQKEVFSQYLIEQGRNDEVAVMMANPAMYADEWAQYLNRSTQPPEVDPAEQQAPQPQMDPSQMGQMPVPPMSIPQPTGHKTADSPRRCPKCSSATTTLMNAEGDMRCHRCGNVWDVDVVTDKPVVSRKWGIKTAITDPIQPGQSPANPVAAPAADATAPGDREQQADSTLSWQSTDGTPLQVGQTYEMHSSYSSIPDMVKIDAVKPDAITVTMVGEYNAPSDPQDANGPGYTHELDLNEAQAQNLTFNPVQTGEGEEEQSQDQTQQDGIGQTVNTEPVEQPHDSFPTHAAVEEQPTDKCPKCDYGHVTSNYTSPETVRYECYRCAHAWEVAEENEGHELNPEARSWLNEDSGPDSFNFDRVIGIEASKSGKGRNISDIAAKDPRNQEIHDRLESNKTAGAKFSPREQREFIEEDGVARNADRLSLDGTHYVSAFDNSKANPDKVDGNYLGLGL